MSILVLAFANACAIAASASVQTQVSGSASLIQISRLAAPISKSVTPDDDLQTFISSCVSGTHPKTCPFVKEELEPLSAHDCAMEMSTVSEVQTYIAGSGRKVLELGARYGTASCTIAHAVASKGGSVVSVEADPRVWEPLSKNIKSNDCKVNLVKGVISKEKVYSQGGRNRYANSVSTDPKGDPTPNFDLSDVMKKYNVDKFDTMVADCQGCVPKFLDENPELLKTLTLILMEEDQHGSGAKADAFYDPLHEKLERAGFKVKKHNIDEGSRHTNRGDWIWVRDEKD